jgi:hypothetical protein
MDIQSTRRPSHKKKLSKVYDTAAFDSALPLPQTNKNKQMQMMRNRSASTIGVMGLQGAKSAIAKKGVGIGLSKGFSMLGGVEFDAQELEPKESNKQTLHSIENKKNYKRE